MYIKNTIYGYSPELEGLGFEHHEEAPTYREYSRPVEKSEIESAYKVKWIPQHEYGALLKDGEWV